LGERSYLSRLLCANGQNLKYKRVGSFGPRTTLPVNLSNDEMEALLQRSGNGMPLEAGEPDYHIVDGYDLECGEVTRRVYMDMYHCHQQPPIIAPTGFSFKTPPTVLAAAHSEAVPVFDVDRNRCPTQVGPYMPREALRDRVQGVVKAQMHVRDGIVQDVVILSGPSVYGDSVKLAMMQYKCANTPAEFFATQTFTFKIE
jgi:hypothetical protein